MLKETLDRLDEKFLTNPRSKMSYLNGDEKRELVKFVEEEIKLAREETIMEVESKISKIPKIEMTFSDIKDVLNKLKKYETIRNVLKEKIVRSEKHMMKLFTPPPLKSPKICKSIMIGVMSKEERI